MTTATSPPPGLDRLVALLRAARLSVPVGASETIDAARLLAHLARHPGSTPPSLERLRLQLRPVLCKAAGDQPAFDEAFDAWQQEWQLALQRSGLVSTALPGATAGAPDAAAGPAAKGGAPATPPATPPPTPPAANNPAAPGKRTPPARLPTPRWRRRAGWLAAAVVLAAAGGWLVQQSGNQPTQPQPQPAPLPASPASVAASARPSTPYAGQAAPTLPPALPADSASAPVVRGFAPDWIAQEVLRLPWLLLVLGLPLLGLLALAGAPPPLQHISRQRGNGSLTLEGWPPNRQRRLLVRDLAPSTSGQLQRHVRGAVAQREAYARRPMLDMRRTVLATLARGGVLQLHHRFARLRPAYLVLVHARSDDDLGVLWAQRLADLDVRAAVFRFHADDPDAVPLCVEVGGFGRRLPATALPAPWPEQRLLVIAATGVLVGDDGQLRGWVQRARLQRWAQRALFSPDEPRHWPRGHVERLEAGGPGDPGMLVLPFEDGALDAWSTWLVRGELPRITLEAPQRYPALLRESEARFVGDTQPADLHPEPPRAAALAEQLVTQLQAYLGQNGFYWLCACAVPPLLETRLALLLGEEYFRRCGATEARVAAYMARNWRLLLRLPWLRPAAGQNELQALPQLPQWLRLALLARLPVAIQDELREVVRGALGRRSAGRGAAGSLSLAFDAPDDADADAAAGNGISDPRHALLVGFVRDGLQARELMLRLPGAWQAWLPAMAPRRNVQQRWRRLRADWRRRLQLDVASRREARRWVAAGLLLSGSALAALGLVKPADWPQPWRGWLFQAQSQPVVLGDTTTLWLDSTGRRALQDSPGNPPALIDPASGKALWPAPNDSRSVDHAAFSADGRVLATLTNPMVAPATAQALAAADGKPLGPPVSPDGNVPRVLPSRDGGQLLTAGKSLQLWDVASGALVSELAVPPGRRPLAIAWQATAPGADPRTDGVIAVLADGQGKLAVLRRPRDLAAPGGPIALEDWDISEANFQDLSPDGSLWMFRLSGQLWVRLSPQTPGFVAYTGPFQAARFGANSAHLVLKVNESTTRLLHATTQPPALAAGPTDRPNDLPQGMLWLGDAPVQMPDLPIAAAAAGLVLVVLLALGMAARSRRGQRQPAMKTSA